MEALMAQLSNPILGPLYALIAGILTSTSPCAVGALPLVIGHMAGSHGKTRARDLALFVFGMALTLTASGLVVGLLGKSLSLSAPWVRVVAGVAFSGLGLVYLGVLGGSRTCPGLVALTASNGAAPSITSFSMGLLYGISASPCATPALIAILTLVGTMGSATKGALLLLAYSLGQSSLVIVAGMATSGLKDFLGGEKGATVLPMLRKLGGAIMLVFGLYTAISQLVLSYF